MKGCPLAAALRRKFKQSKRLPRRKFRCVFSEELVPNAVVDNNCDIDTLPNAQGEGGDAWRPQKAQINGTVAHTTAIFGFTLAGLVVQDIWKKTNEAAALRCQK